MSFDQAVELVSAFFSSLGLLPEQYRSEPAFGTNTGVHLARLLDGHPVIYGIGVSPSLVDLELSSPRMATWWRRTTPSAHLDRYGAAHPLRNRSLADFPE